MKDIGVIGSADGPTSIYVSSKSEDFFKSGGIVEEPEVVEIEQVAEETITEETLTKDVNEILNEKTLSENLDAGLKIMGIGMAAVFGVLTILYIIVKIMGQFAKGKSDNEKN